MLVSIILPTYNCAHYLHRSVGSVLRQTYLNWELIIIDNYSVDKTAEVVAKFNDKRIKFLQTHNEGIIAKSRNLGIKEARGDFIAFLDADDWWVDAKLQASIDALISGYDIVYHDLFIKTPNKYFYRKKFGARAKTRNLSSPIYTDLKSNGSGITNSSVVISRKILLDVGLISENPKLVAAEDYDCWLRVAKITEKFHRISKVYGYYWVAGSSVSQTIKSLNYLNELGRLYFDKESYPDWMLYAIGKAHFKSNDLEKAKIELNKIHLKADNWKIFIKAFVMRGFILWRNMLKCFFILKSS